MISSLRLSLRQRVPKRNRTKRTLARQAVFSTFFVFFFATALYSGLAETIVPTMRDPEHGKKLKRLNAAIATRPNDPLVVFLGSSRFGMGIKPTELHSAFGTDGPLCHNHSYVGAGPLFNLLAYSRLRKEGIRPNLLVVEYWPIMFKQTGIDQEQKRFDTARLFYADSDIINRYFDSPEKTYQEMQEARWNPFTIGRARIVSFLVASWIPLHMRADSGWASIDATGWFPGPAEIEHEAILSQIEIKWKGILNDYSIGDVSVRATKELLDLCREDGVPVVFVWMPETQRFRNLYPPQVLAECERFNKDILEPFHVPLLNLRASMDDKRTPDGFHLSERGAKEFAPVLAKELRNRFPQIMKRGTP